MMRGNDVNKAAESGVADGGSS